MKNYAIESAIIALGLMVMGYFIKSGLGQVANKERIVNVKGLAEMEVPANKVTWPLVVKYFDNDIKTLYREVNETNKKVTDYLKQNGIKEEEISIKAPEIVDTRADRYQGTSQPTARYFVTSIITVTSNNVKLVRQLISKQSDLLSVGIVIAGDDYDHNTTYEYTDLNRIKPKMIEEATQNARTSAEKFAKDSESTLGKIKDAYQGQFEIEDRDANTPYIKKIRIVTTVNYYLDD
ncbi:MAG: SIMPL domain-containing protein [Paludibacteraceae bacterium]|jgi:hypothetical protein|nr:SIMPL domain-containing protein [Paludibacteraceae bacterium]